MIHKYFKKFFIYLLTSLTVFFVMSAFYLYIPKVLESVDNKLRDYMFIVRGKLEDTHNVVIIDIDDRSLQKIGQWPWDRTIVSNVLSNLTNAGAGLIAFDMVFPEEDRTSPKKIIEKFNIKTDKKLPDNDLIFASTISQTPTILGYQFQLSDDDFIDTKSPEIPAIFIEKNRNILNKDMVINAYGTILNFPIIQDNSYSSGFFNNVPDEAGIIRSVPLIIRYNEQLFPSLALEVIRVISGVKKVIVNYDMNGVTNIQLGKFDIPTDRYGRIIVNFKGGVKSFQYISAVDILNNSFEHKDIEGKIVIIGTSAAGLLDLRATPFDSIYPGVEVHANVIDNILMDNYLYKPSWTDGLNIVHILFLSILITLIIIYLAPAKALFLVILITLADNYILFYLLFDKGLILSIFFPLSTIITATIFSYILNYFLERKQSLAIKHKFASKVSKEVMESLLEQQESEAFAAMEKEITIFFSDVRNFTDISESTPHPRILIEFLNEYMDPMTEIIIKEKGTVDKFIGDAIMAYWNAPGDVPDHATKALNATLEQLHLLETLNKKIKQDPRFQEIVTMTQKKGVEPIDIGIGLNTGIAVVGEMGSSKRSDYTIIGDPVNLGARLESLCKFYNSKCNISNFTKERIDENAYILRFLDLVTVKGKKEPVEIWQVIDYNRDETEHTLYNVPKKTLLDELKLYHKAIELYKKSDFTKALEIFEKLQSKENKTNKNIYKIYIERCEHYIKTPPKDFNGVFVHTTKG